MLTEVSEAPQRVNVFHKHWTCVQAPTVGFLKHELCVTDGAEARIEALEPRGELSGGKRLAHLLRG